MIKTLASLAEIQTAVVFRGSPPQEAPHGNVRALAIKNLVATEPVRWATLPRVELDNKYLGHCLRPGDVVLPSRGDYYFAWLFEGADEPVFPLGQLNIIRAGVELNPYYLVWYLNQKTTQTQISLLLTGTGIKAMTKSSLLALQVETPPLSKQKEIAEVDMTTKQIIAIRHRLNELDKYETTYLTRRLLKTGGACA
jgi:hypothetical protein